MTDLQKAGERISELEGALAALEVLAGTLLRVLAPSDRDEAARAFDRLAEAGRKSMLAAAASEDSLAAFARETVRFRTLIDAIPTRAAQAAEPEIVDPVLFTSARISTFIGTQALTGASGFFFEQGDRLFLVTSRHVVVDAPSGHLPDRLEIEIHTGGRDLTQSTGFSMLLYRDGVAVWHQGEDSGGEIDVAVLEIDRALLPSGSLRAFTPAHLLASLQDVAVGTSLLIVGFPLGFHDGLHHLPVARQASVASAFGVRFQGQGFFLTDARMHRGSSGAPVLMRDPAAAPGSLPWKLLGVHSARMDMTDRDQHADESLGLNCAWYADILLTLTAAEPAEPTAAAKPAS